MHVTRHSGRVTSDSRAARSSRNGRQLRMNNHLYVMCSLKLCVHAGAPHPIRSPANAADGNSGQTRKSQNSVRRQATRRLSRAVDTTDGWQQKVSRRRCRHRSRGAAENPNLPEGPVGLENVVQVERGTRRPRSDSRLEAACLQPFSNAPPGLSGATQYEHRPAMRCLVMKVLCHVQSPLLDTV